MADETFKIKITQPGWEGYTGPFGALEFVDGVSVREATQVEVDRVAASILVVKEGTDEQVGVQKRMLEAHASPITEEAFKAISQAQFDTLTKAPAAPAPVSPTEKKLYTNEELLAIADEKGIAGLRDIGNERGVKGRAIPELIANILAEQTGAAPAAEAPAAPAAPAA